jgi:hypothetical protein
VILRVRRREGRGQGGRVREGAEEGWEDGVGEAGKRSGR